MGLTLSEVRVKLSEAVRNLFFDAGPRSAVDVCFSHNGVFDDDDGFFKAGLT